ncbi:hypothetical protein ACN9MH_04820 [Paenibacillus silvae]|jgi:hypothetical protein|uniref:hypothetical protein n=1 Tax=Paenibacillus TaxID=44249 RepID=UPI001C110CD6|nr:MULTISPECIES: hypothetical protein [Paenibacillus]MBU5353310.1 hypothetical protein [Paenibacillus barcinonensis]MDM5279730.1 hypothetical protein [Paenibacillus silvae]
MKMVNPQFKKWLQLAETVKETVPNRPLLNCPNCNSNNIAYEFIGDSQKREGYFLIWCNNCLEGVHISRINIPELAKMIPFGSPSELTSHIPNFTKINP